MQAALSVSDILSQIGMHPKYKGRSIITDILTITLCHPYYIHKMGSRVYPLLLEHYSCTRATADRTFVLQ